LIQPQPLIEACRISKAFPGVQALQNVDLRAFPGELLAVVGENGAGKSTLMKILGGVQGPDEGTLRIDGAEVRLRNVNDATERGIVLIHQELNLAEELDVAANVFLGREPTLGGPLRFIRRQIYSEAEAILRRLGLDCSPRTRVADLTAGQQQLVEIARALSLKSRVLIMDEPTSSLTEREAERLFEVIHGLRAEGICILYISHRLKEVENLADRAVVLRDGKNAGELQRGEINRDNLVRLMVGRELKQFFPRMSRPIPGDGAEVLLSVKGVRLTGAAPPSDFTVGAGEIVGMAGLMGSGRTEMAEVLFGLRKPASGEVWLDGRRVDPSSPGQAVDAGICLVPEDRRSQGLILTDSVARNLTLASLARVSWFGLVRDREERRMAENLVARLNVRTAGIDKMVGLLSGGNQQKVVLGKWLAREPRLLILDEPTRGVDVGAKAEIYALMDQLTSTGMGILMISSDLEEILGMSDRVLVMHEGRLAGELPRSALGEEAIMHLATGGGTR
jgi:ribose transport system ATP-binding protein